MLWYFAYGSNMQRATFEGRRGMRPVESCCGRLDGWRLCFDLPVGRGERGVANLTPDESSHVYGVLHRITPAEFERLDRTEGVGNGYYRREFVTVDTLERERITAVTYVSTHGVAGRKPSARYLGLLLEGADEYGLPREYVETLQRLDLAHDERLDSS